MESQIVPKLSWGAQPDRWRLQKDIFCLTLSVIDWQCKPECYEEAVQVEAKAEWELVMNDEIRLSWRTKHEIW